MIRVNLLPHREEKRRARRQQFYALAGLALALGAAVVLAVHTVIAGYISYKDVKAAHPWDEPIPTPLPSQNLLETDFSGKCSWSKAPRYMGHAAEAGPLSRVIMAGNPANLKHQNQDPLFLDVIKNKGVNVFSRTLARLHEAPRLYNYIDEWLRQIDLNGEFYIKPEERDGKGWGATEAARALAHWVEIKNGVIEKYQVMAPTTWNEGQMTKIIILDLSNRH